VIEREAGKRGSPEVVRSIRSSQLICKIRQIGNRCLGKQGRDCRSKIGEQWGIFNGFCIRESACSDKALRSSVDDGEQQTSSIIEVQVGGKCSKGIYQLRRFASEVVDAAAKVLAQFEGFKVEASYDSEVIRAAFESGKEIGVVSCVGVAD